MKTTQKPLLSPDRIRDGSPPTFKSTQIDLGQHSLNGKMALPAMTAGWLIIPNSQEDESDRWNPTF